MKYTYDKKSGYVKDIKTGKRLMTTNEVYLALTTEQNNTLNLLLEAMNYIPSHSILYKKICNLTYDT